MRAAVGRRRSCTRRSTAAWRRHTAVIEFLVDDVDAEYQKLADVIETSLVQEPTTMPWANRALPFRDPDGNLVNFFTPVTPEAMKKFEKRRAH